MLIRAVLGHPGWRGHSPGVASPPPAPPASSGGVRQGSGRGVSLGPSPAAPYSVSFLPAAGSPFSTAFPHPATRLAVHGPRSEAREDGLGISRSGGGPGSARPWAELGPRWGRGGLPGPLRPPAAQPRPPLFLPDQNRASSSPPEGRCPATSPRAPPRVARASPRGSDG